MRKFMIPGIGLLLILFGLSATAQIRGTCATTDYAYFIERVTSHQATLRDAPLVLRSPVEKYVPVAFHLTGDDSGNGYPRFEQVLDQLATLNTLYAEQEMIMYIDEVNYVPNNTIYTAPSSPSAVFQMKLVRDGDAMDVFVTESAENSGESPGVTLGYYSSTDDWIVMRKSELNSFNGTLGHEIGHFFSLPHPHLGWECDPYDEDVHGNPVNSIWSPCIGSLRVENQSGNNCNNAGDMICDTPPDYNFGFGWSVGGDQCAEFTEIVMDPTGDTVDPMENNVMAYFLDCDDYVFTDNQKSIIQTDFFGTGRSYLRTGYIPETEPVTEDVLYNSPVNDEVTPTYDFVELTWEPVPGATDYLVIIDRVPTFSLQPQRFFADEPYLPVQTLSPGLRYYWSVWPYNESQTGKGYSGFAQFITGVSSAVEEIPYVEMFEVYPNPASDDHLMISIESQETFTPELEILDLTGRIVQSVGAEIIRAGQVWSKELDISDFPAGLYIVHMQSEDGVLSRKVSVQ